MALESEFQIYPTGIEIDLLKLSRLAEDDHILQEVKNNFPELKILVIDLKNPLFPEETVIQWRDSTTSMESYQFYSEYTETMIQSVAFYLAPKAVLEAHPNRPDLESPIMVIKQNSPYHVVLHEIAHFLIDMKQRRNDLNLIIADNFDLNSLIHKISEEIYVDYLLIANAANFDFQLADICFRQKYLKQNLRVFNSILREILKEKPVFTKRDQKTLSALNKLYGKASSLQLKYHTQCFLY